jgi:hypothetical protein
VQFGEVPLQVQASDAKRQFGAQHLEKAEDVIR